MHLKIVSGPERATVKVHCGPCFLVHNKKLKLVNKIQMLTKKKKKKGTRSSSSQPSANSKETSKKFSEEKQINELLTHFLILWLSRRSLKYQ